jgi:hypothetical protein
MWHFIEVIQTIVELKYGNERADSLDPSCMSSVYARSGRNTDKRPPLAGEVSA